MNDRDSHVMPPDPALSSGRFTTECNGFPPPAASRILADSIVVGGSLSAVKLIGAVKVVLIAHVFGAGDALDAFLVAYIVPTFFADVVAGALPSALIPALIEVRERHGKASLDRLQSGITAAALVLFTSAAVVLWLASPAVLRLLGSGFDGVKREFAHKLFSWLLPLLPLGGLSVVWRAFLNARERFAAPALAPATTPLLTIVLLALAGTGATVSLLAAACLAGMILELAWLGLAVKREGIALLPRWSGWDPAIRGVAMQYLPLIAVAVIAGGNLIVDQSMAAMLGSGSVSALGYGTKLATVLAAIAGSALGTAVLPQFSRMIAMRDGIGLRRALRAYTGIILLAGVPLTIALIAGSGPLVRALFQRGAFTAEAAGLVTAIQRLSLMQLPLSVLLAMLLRLVSSMNANALLVRVALLAFAVNIAADYLLMGPLGTPGIALSSALVQLTSLICVILLIRKRLPAPTPC